MHLPRLSGLLALAAFVACALGAATSGDLAAATGSTSAVAASISVSPWFFTHYGPSSYNKNWIFYADYQWNSRWEQVLQLAPQFVEIVTWNDFSESHYIGPLHPSDTSVYAGGSAGAVQWVTGFPHDAWRDIAAPYIAAYKAGATSPTVTTEELVYYYRPNPKNAGCSDSVTQPTGYQDDGDSIFVIVMAKSAGTVVITSGSTSTSISVPAGITTVSAPMSTGVQSFALTRSGATVLSGTSPLQVTSSCSVYNFNAHSGGLWYIALAFLYDLLSHCLRNYITADIGFCVVQDSDIRGNLPFEVHISAGQKNGDSDADGRSVKGLGPMPSQPVPPEHFFGRYKLVSMLANLFIGNDQWAPGKLSSGRPVPLTPFCSSAPTTDDYYYLRDGCYIRSPSAAITDFTNYDKVTSGTLYTRVHKGKDLAIISE
ncbi:glycoside hydrolase family 71 protein [Athelia psychrophila]|uniref:Glycoside hydrolase family 71 protein n=1 Tax=Athelia psychrophila TaxID=1759441 RepID=A0A166SG58_9AGAM|nr:glycoside hydrolase family 71 protein [Fibularhizoctonia sp. CBS 109695]